MCRQVPQQSNSHDCGIYMLFFIETFLQYARSVNHDVSALKVWPLLLFNSLFYTLIVHLLFHRFEFAHEEWSGDDKALNNGLIANYRRDVKDFISTLYDMYHLRLDGAQGTPVTAAEVDGVVHGDLLDSSQFQQQGKLLLCKLATISVIRCHRQNPALHTRSRRFERQPPYCS